MDALQLRGISKFTDSMKTHMAFTQMNRGVGTITDNIMHTHRAFSHEGLDRWSAQGVPPIT